MKAGGVCIGCTMPGFPDRFSPFYKTPPGSTLSTTASRSVGLFTRPLRRITQQFLNMEKRWEKSEHIPSGWGYVETPSTTRKVMHYFYDVWRHVGAKGKR